MPYKKVTLYIPCYNAEKYIIKCLEGVLRQTYPIDEILIIDDGSTDKTVEIALNYPVKIIKHGKNKGLAAARNTAFKNAKNEYVAALDADCVPEPDWLEKLMENFTDDIVGVGGKLIEKYTNTLADKWRAVHMRQHWGDKKIVNPPFLHGCNNVYRKDIIEEIGFYDEKFRTNAEDVDLCRRLRRKGYNFIYEPKAIVKHLRKDNVFSVLNTYWRYHNPTPSLHTIFKLAKKMLSNFLWASYLITIDAKHKKFDLILIDFILPFYLSKIAILEYVKGR